MAKGGRRTDCGLQISDCGLKKTRGKEKAESGRGRGRQGARRRGKQADDKSSLAKCKLQPKKSGTDKAKGSFTGLRRAARLPESPGGSLKAAGLGDGRCLAAVAPRNESKESGPYSDRLFRSVDPEAVHAAYANRKLPPRDGKDPASPPANQAPPRPVRPRCCKHCMHANRMRDGRRVLWICANAPRSPGEIVRVQPKGICPNFRFQREVPVRFPASGPLEEGARLIALSRGLFAVVDAEDFERLNRHKWSALVTQHTCYATRGEKNRMILMHREIMNNPPGMVIDHLNHNGLYNRRRNLRVCTQAENNSNCGVTRPHSSRYRGVSRVERLRKWSSAACFRGRTVHCGTFESEEAAARARDYKTVQLHGPYAYLNFPDEWPFARRQAVYDEYQAQAAELRQECSPREKRKKSPLAKPQRAQRKA